MRISLVHKHITYTHHTHLLPHTCTPTPTCTLLHICIHMHMYTHTVRCPLAVSPRSCTRYGTQSDTVHLRRNYSTSQTLESPFLDCSRPQNYVHCNYSSGHCKVYYCSVPHIRPLSHVSPTTFSTKVLAPNYVWPCYQNSSVIFNS